MQQYFVSGARLAQTVWVGALLTVGYLVAPVLFHSLDKQVAGQVAGQLFYSVAIIGLICGPLMLLQQWSLRGKAALRHWRPWVILAMLLLVIVGVAALQPAMQELKIQGLAPGSEQAASFGKLHGISSILYLCTSVMGLALVILPVKRSDS